MYDVALLIERELAELDADQIIALHEGLTEKVRYHLLLPLVDDSSYFVASIMDLGEPVIEPRAVRVLHDEAIAAAQAELDTSSQLLEQRGQSVLSRLTQDSPITALRALVDDVDAAEAIILTEPHLVRELLHLDWTSRARRAINVPILHLIEHLPFGAQR